MGYELMNQMAKQLDGATPSPSPSPAPSPVPPTPTPAVDEYRCSDNQCVASSGGRHPGYQKNGRGGSPAMRPLSSQEGFWLVSCSVRQIDNGRLTTLSSLKSHPQERRKEPSKRVLQEGTGRRAVLTRKSAVGSLEEATDCVPKGATTRRCRPKRRRQSPHHRSRSSASRR